MLSCHTVNRIESISSINEQNPLSLAQCRSKSSRTAWIAPMSLHIQQQQEIPLGVCAGQTCWEAILIPHHHTSRTQINGKQCDTPIKNSKADYSNNVLVQNKASTERRARYEVSSNTKITWVWHTWARLTVVSCIAKNDLAIITYLKVYLRIAAMCKDGTCSNSVQKQEIYNFSIIQIISYEFIIF